MTHPEHPEASGGGQNPGEPHVYSQPFHNQPVAARVPERVGKGVFTTGLLVQDGPFEFVLDFMQQLSQPKQVVARVILTPNVMGALVRTLDENLNRFVQTFGPPQALPRPNNPQRPTIQEIYENFKLPEEMWSGTYANSVLIGHGPAEFFMDFITGFYPTAAVSARIYFSAQQAPRILETIRSSFVRRMNLQQQQQQHPQQHQAPDAGGPPTPPENPPEPDDGIHSH